MLASDGLRVFALAVDGHARRKGGPGSPAQLRAAPLASTARCKTEASFGNAVLVADALPSVRDGPLQVG